MKIHNLKSKVKAMLKYKRLWIIILLPVSAAVVILARNNPQFAEWYAKHIYRYISLFWNNISGILPFSLAEIIVILLPFCIIAFVIYTVIRLVKRRGRRLKIFYESIINVICTVCAVLFLFVSNCGINYYRYTFSELNGFEVKKSSVDELYDICIILAQKLTQIRQEVSEDNGIMCLDTETISTEQKAVNSMNKLSESYNCINSGYSVPKKIMLSHYMSYTHITGVFFPFTFEANVNVDISDYSIPVTMCHELTHLSGFMREDEANFTAFLACINSDYEDFRYSGYMLAYSYTANTLYSESPEKYRNVYAYLSDDVIKDMQKNAEYWKQFETPVAQVASDINDSYLKSNSQSDGVKSYGRMVDLLIAYYNNS